MGPPKTAFSSAAAARNGSKTRDSTQPPAYGPTDESFATNDNHSHKEKLTKDSHKTERDGERTRETRFGALHSRRGTKDDHESWSNSRQQKGLTHDDTERGYRKNGDRDQEKAKDVVRDSKHQRGFDNHRRDGDRDGNGENVMRRNGAGRGRFEPSWHQTDDRHERTMTEGEKDTARPRDWRDKDTDRARGVDREWHKTSNLERDPEWMDEPEPEDKAQTHTQEDFERWKERMKANKGPAQDLPSPPIDHRPSHERAISNISLHTGKSKAETPLIVDPSFDGFFGLWNEQNREDWRQGAEEHHTNNTAKPNVPKPSKFTGFFSPKFSGNPTDIETVVPPTSGTAKDTSNEDKEGFQRILKLLGTPTQEIPARTTPRSPPLQPPRSREPNGLESLLGPQLPKDGPVPQNRDSEFLLKLMQQTQQTRPNLSQVNHIEHRLGAAQAPGLLPFSNLIVPPRDMTQQAPPTGPPLGFVNESTREDVQARDKLNPNALIERKGLPPGFLESSTPGHVQRNSNVGISNHQGLITGLQRPPGLEQISSAYGQIPQPQRQGIVPPPGFPHSVRNHNQFPPGLMPNIAASNNPNDRAPPPYGVRHIGPAGMPPPGFMGLNPQPLGFIPPQFNHDGRTSPPGRLWYGGGPQRQGHDSFNEAANFGMIGQGMLPGQYRRQE